MVIKTDVLIIGGGPAGSYLARYLVRNGFSSDVMLIDKKTVIYAPIICGELLPSEDLLKPWINEDLYEVLLTTLKETLRREFIVNRINWMRLVINGHDIARIPFRTYVINKAAMIRNVIEEAINGGAKVRFGVTATKCAVKGDGYECLVHDKDSGEYMVSAKALVGADAYPSIIDLSLGITSGFRAEDLIIATSSRAGGKYVEDEAVIVMDPEVAPGGFAWVFPRGDGTHNIGIGIRNNVAWRGDNPLNYHMRFVNRYGLESIQRSVLMKTLPVGGLLNRYGVNNAYLIGDAVGSVIPTNGAGINPAMITAHLLGESLIHGSNYSVLMDRLLRPLMDRMVMFRRTGDPLLMNRDAMETALRVSSGLMAGSIYEATLSSMRFSTFVKFLIGNLLIRLISRFT